MTEQKTLTCHTCKEKFPKGEMIQISSLSGKTNHWYCAKCANEKHARERFSDKVCAIFGLKSPGPRIWNERKRIQNEYGYTDDTIIDCLDYIYNVLKTKKLAESLCLVNPVNIERMKQYKNKEEYNSNKLATAMQTKIIEHVVTIKENNKNNKIDWNPDDWIE